MIKKIVKNINKLMELLIGFMMIAMTILILVQILFRSVLNKSLPWSTELATFMFSWIVFFGATIGFKSKSHFSVDMFFSKLPIKIQVFLNYLVDLLVSIFLLVTAKYGFELVGKTTKQLSPALKIPMSIMYAVIPIGCVLMLIYLWVYRGEEEEN